MNTNPTIICNKALGLIGAAAIGNLDDAGDRSVSATKCRLFWPTISLAVCRAHPWKCISRQVSLTQAAPTPVHTYHCAFYLPVDYLRIIESDSPKRQYRIFGRVIQCNTSPFYMDYVMIPTDWSLITADLERCLYLNMAYELAYAIGMNLEAADRIKAELERFFLPLARMTDAVEGGYEESESGTFTDLFDL